MTGKTVRQIFLFILFCIARHGPGYGQVIKAEAKLDTNAMLIGDQVRLSLGFSVPKDFILKWPDIPDTILGHLQVIARGRMDTSWSVDKKIVSIHQKLVLTSFDSGFFAIPAIRFYYKVPPDTTIRFEQAQTLFLKVNTLAVDTTKEIKPIKGPLHVPLSFREMLPWILLGLFLLAAGYAIFYIIRKRRKAEPIFRIRPKIRLLPHELALMEFEKLRVKKLWQAGKIKEYHSELTEILRRYIEDRFQSKAMESTTIEILNDLKDRTEIEPASLSDLGQILTLADMVKFAKQQTLASENEECLSKAIDFVNSTIPKVKEVTEETKS
jgi:hypothetical protein